ncbi:MAG: multidrug MFS transporter [Pseudomonadales bacterium]|nr:multidrug MFS transporter [Pseudomonadales bacterium]
MTVHNTYLLDSINSSSEQAAMGVERRTAHSGFPIVLQKLAAAVALLLLSPLLILLALLIRMESKGSPLYAQIRVGENGRRFKFYKFRSMFITGDARWVDVNTLSSDRDGVCKKFKRDPRITSIGRIIRKYSIDEIPQLINVLKGDMVLIGPRPALCSETDCYSTEQMNRLDVKPGLTGLWQVSGRADTTFEQQVELDIFYIDNQSWWFDIKIVLQTIPAVLLSKGAY